MISLTFEFISTFKGQRYLSSGTGGKSTFLALFSDLIMVCNEWPPLLSEAFQKFCVGIQTYSWTPNVHRLLVVVTIDLVKVHLHHVDPTAG